MKSLMKKTFTLIFAGVMFVTPISVEAATSGGQGTSTLTVVTKANWKKPGSESVTLSNRQVVVQGYKRTLTGKKKLQTKKYYPRYKITVKSTDGTHSFSKSMTSSSLKLNLKPDKNFDTSSLKSLSSILIALSKLSTTVNNSFISSSFLYF